MSVTINIRKITNGYILTKATTKVSPPGGAQPSPIPPGMSYSEVEETYVEKLDASVAEMDKAFNPVVVQPVEDKPAEELSPA